MACDLKPFNITLPKLILSTLHQIDFLSTYDELLSQRLMNTLQTINERCFKQAVRLG